jgi:CheY-like chemotaxis protein
MSKEVQDMEKKKVLIIDDVAIFRHLIKTYLGRTSFETFTAQSGEEGIEKAISILPDLIILDLVMSGATGDEVCRTLKRDPKTGKIPIIIISSLWGESVKERCIEAGCDAFLYKPIRQDTLLATVAEHLKMGSRAEKRAYTYLTCFVSHGEYDSETRIHSMSRSGAFIEMENPGLPGETIEATFSLPKTRWEVNVSAEIVWVGKLGDKGPIGAGVRFKDLDHVGEEMINRYVKAQTVLKQQEETENKISTGE